MQKICYVIPEYDPQTATHFRYLYGFVEQIRSQLNLFLVIEKNRSPKPYPGENYHNHLSWSPLRFVEDLILFSILRFKGYKTVYVHYSFLAALASSLVMRLTCGRVFYWNCGLPWQYHKKWSREVFERLTYHLINFLVTGTKGLKQQYAANYNLSLEKIRVMPNWIDLLAWQKKTLLIPKNDLRQKLELVGFSKIILFVHRLSRRKGVQYLTELLISLPEGAVCVVIGDGPERARLEQAIINQKLDSKIKLLGALPQETIAEYMAIADAVLMPSEEEGFPHVALEAMASGLPLVAFAAGGVGEIIAPGLKNFVAPPGDVASLKAKLHLALNLNETERAELAREEKEWVARYDIHQVAKIFLAEVVK